MKRYSFYTALLIVLTGLSCSKGGNAGGGDDEGPHVVSPNDVTAPVLDIYTPTANQVFANGSSINITGKISDDLGLYNGSIRITNDANGELVKQQLYEIHGVLTYNFNITHTVSVTAATDYTITISFEDHGLNKTTKTVKIKANP